MKRIFTMFCFIYLFCFFGGAQEVVEITLGECDSDVDPYYIHSERLISQNYFNDTLFLELGLVRACSFEPSFELELSGDSLIFVIKDTASIIEMCYCCFELTLAIVDLPNTNLTFYEKYEFYEQRRDSLYKREVKTAFTEIKYYDNKFFYPLPDLILDSDCDNKYDVDSTKVGHWCYYDEKTGKLIAKSYFPDNNQNKYPSWTVRYEKRKPIEVCADINSFTTYRQAVTQCIRWDKYLELFK